MKLLVFSDVLVVSFLFVVFWLHNRAVQTITFLRKIILLGNNKYHYDVSLVDCIR